MSPIDTFVAIGDSFTEGLEDHAPGGGLRGWADMVAAALAVERPAFRSTPWLRRRLTGASSGDGLSPKRPDLLPI